jgi:hypothetical protein
VTPIFDLRQLGARSPGTCQVTAGRRLVHQGSTQTVTRRGCNRMRRGPAGAHRIAEHGAKPAHSGEPMIGNTPWASPPPDPGSAATRCAADGSCLCVGQDEAIKDLPEACRPASSPLEDRRNRGDKRFGGPLVHTGRCPLYVRAQPEAAGLAWTQRDINGPKAAAREVSKTPGHGPFPQVVAGVGFEPT